MMYIQCVYTPLFNPGHISLMWSFYNMYEQKNNYQEGYEQFVKKSLERLTSHFGNYSGGYSLQSKKNFDYAEYS